MSYLNPLPPVMRPPAGRDASLWDAVGALSVRVRVLPLVTRKMLSGVSAASSYRRTWPFKSTVASPVTRSVPEMVTSSASVYTPLPRPLAT